MSNSEVIVNVEDVFDLEVEVESVDVTIEVEAPGVVSFTPADGVIPVEATGGTGPPGPAGGAAAAYIHTQATPSAEWIVNHNLGYRPSVEVFTVGGVEINPPITHVNDFQFRVYVNPPIAGTARAM